ncbi:MAG: translation initiation factor 2 [Firmicutes bacterium]|nr:translation initiation factor 2 [Bacillota bacterium]
MRLDWKQMEPQEETDVIKGCGRRVIVVKSPDPKLFEEAIFVLRDDVFKDSERSTAQILREAKKVADNYLRTKTGKRRFRLSRFPAPFFAAAGAAATGIAWLALKLVGV